MPFLINSLADPLWSSPREYSGTLTVYYIYDLPSCLTVSKSLLFIDDTKIYNVASNPQDTTALQRDLDSATLWSERLDMYFNPMKSIHLCINAKAITEYRIADTNIVTKNIHKDLGIVMCDDLSWNQHYEKNNTKSLQNAGAASALFQPVSICFCQENIILIFGNISSYLLFETNPDKAYYPCRTNPKESNKVYFK